MEDQRPLGLVWQPDALWPAPSLDLSFSTCKTELLGCFRGIVWEQGCMQTPPVPACSWGSAPV